MNRGGALQRLQPETIPTSEMQALATMAAIEKELISKGFWYTISRVVEGELKWIKIEASLRVKS